MPKDTATPSPTSPISKPSDNPARMSDVALRKKKNADAQAAFRARRANYIATLEETVTSLESVVIQLQESCRESRHETVELRQENARLRHENRERERFWRALFQARKAGQISDSDDLPSSLASPFPGHAQPSALPVPLSQHPYPNGLPYRGDAACPQSSYNTQCSTNNFGSHATFNSGESSVDGSSGPSLRGGKYAGYPYGLQGSPRDARWQVPQALPTNLNGPESITPPHSHSPAYMESPALTSTDMTYNTNGRFSGDEQKVALTSVLENAPYVFPNGDRYHHNVGESIPNSRSMSPTSTPGSSASVPLTSSFPFSFPEHSAGQDRPDFDYRRQPLPQCPEVTLHGGTADISQSADVRYRVGARGPDSSAGHQALLPGSENGSQHDQGSSDGDPPFENQHSRLRRNTIHAHSRSPSPGPAPISCTVAVIKAQAFGALRRTRTRTKKSSEGAAKVAMGVLEARGIGIGGPVGPQRAHPQDEDEIEMETP